MPETSPAPEEKIKHPSANAEQSSAGNAPSANTPGGGTSRKIPVIKLQSQGPELVFRIPPKKASSTPESTPVSETPSKEPVEPAIPEKSTPPPPPPPQPPQPPPQIQIAETEPVIQISATEEQDKEKLPEKEKKIPVAIIDRDEEVELTLPKSKSQTEEERKQKLREKLEMLKTRGRHVSSAQSYATQPSSRLPDETPLPKAEGASQPEQIETAPVRSFFSRAAPWIKLGAGVIAVLIIILVLLKLRADEKRRQRERYLFIKQEMNIVDGIYSNMLASRGRIVQFATKAKFYADEAQNMLFTVLKERIENVEPDEETTDVVLQPARPIPLPSPSAPAGTSAGSSENLSSSDEKPPAGLLSRKELEAMRGTSTGVVATTSPPPSVTSTPGPQPKSPPRKEKPPEPAIKKLTRQVLKDALVISNENQNVSSIISEDENLRSQAFTYLDPVMLQRCHTKLEADLRSITDTELRVKDMFANIESNYMEIARIKQNFEVEERKRKQEEEKRKQERERRTLIEHEQNLIKTDQMYASGLLKEDKCNEAIKYLEGKMGQYKTEEASQNLNILIERYKKIAELKKLLIDCINSDPFQWGWGTGSSARDVLKADETGVTLRGGDVVAWSKISFPQLTRFVDHYLSSKKKEKKLLAELALSFALYCYETNETDKAYDYADRAGVLYPAITPEILKLLPKTR